MTHPRPRSRRWTGRRPQHRAVLWWQIRYHIALEAGYDVALRIQQRHLRRRVLEHLAARWLQCRRYGGHPDGLYGFFLDYCRDVEHDVDRTATNRDWELHRVWTNHAALLGDEFDMVCPRPRGSTRPR